MLREEVGIKALFNADFLYESFTNFYTSLNCNLSKV